jgi:hypothetical protein
MASGGFFRQVRITLLLLILFAVAANTWLTQLRTTSWNKSLWMVIYPVDGDGSEATQRYIDTISAADFSDIGVFLADQARRYAVGISEPVTLRLASQVHERPPMPPVGGGTLSIMLWSLKLRYWAWTHDNYDGPAPDVRMFVVFHDPALNDRLQHSLGIQKGLIGVVNAFASPAMASRNNVVIAHEFLHTVGATDKYNPADNQPVYPDGFAEPARQPLYPQRFAEIMGGRIPLSEHRANMPESLAEAAIGSKTAREIRWID